MAHSHEVGRTAEELAERHLVSLGYRILERNWYSGKREADIICSRDTFLVLAEVKAFHHHRITFIDEVVSRRQQRFLVDTAEAYLRLHPRLDLHIRFDVIIVNFREKGFSIEHIEDAFYPEAE